MLGIYYVFFGAAVPRCWPSTDPESPEMYGRSVLNTAAGEQGYEFRGRTPNLVHTVRRLAIWNQW